MARFLNPGDWIRKLRLDLAIASIRQPSQTRVIADVRLSLKDAPEHIAEGLKTIAPECIAYGSLRCQRPIEDPIVQQVIEFLEDNGYRPWAGRTAAGPRNFSLNYERTYSRRDLTTAAALELTLDDDIRGAVRDESGVIRLNPSRKVVSIGGVEHDLASAPGMFMANDGTVVTNSVRRALASAFPKGVVFRPVESTAGPLPAPFWELTSDIVLPPMSSQCKFFDAIDGHEVSGDYDGPFVLREGADFPAFGFRPPEAKYDAASVSKAGPFDLALSFEQFTTPASRLLIASQKFRRVCEGLGIRPSWVPVRVVT